MRPIERLSGNERVTVPSHLLHHKGGDHYVLRVVGDRMKEEGIREGDYVIVLRRSEAEDGEMCIGEVCIVLVEDEASIKRVLHHPAGYGWLELCSADGQNPQTYKEEDVKIQGIVVGLMRKF